MATTKNGFILSYQANSHLYERFDVKRKIVTALVKGDAVNLKSFTDSTIYFEMNIEGTKLMDNCNLILKDQFKKEKITIEYTLGVLMVNGAKGFKFLSNAGNKALNDRFQIIVSEVRKETRKP